MARIPRKRGTPSRHRADKPRSKNRPGLIALGGSCLGMKKGLDRNGIEAVQFPMRTIAESDPSTAPEQGAVAFGLDATRDFPEGFLHEAIQFAEGFKVPDRNTIANNGEVNRQPVTMGAIHRAARAC